MQRYVERYSQYHVDYCMNTENRITLKLAWNQNFEQQHDDVVRNFRRFKQQRDNQRRYICYIRSINCFDLVIDTCR